MNNKKVMKFLRWFCPEHLYEEISGDLLQRYARDVGSKGARKAKWKLFWNTLRFFRPGILLRNNVQFNFLRNTMIGTHFSFAYRMMSRNKAFSLVSIFGLSVSVAASIIVAEYARLELHYDDFFRRSENIYRLQHDRFINNEQAYRKAMVFPEIGLALRDAFPEIEAIGRLFPVSTNIEPVFTAISHGEKTSFSEPEAYFADSTFCDVFRLDFIHGDASTALDGPDRIVLSRTAALRYFGKLDVVGETLHGSAGIADVQVTGVFNDLPPNTHLKFDVLMSWYKVYGDRSRFTWDGFYTYVLLKPDIEPAEIERRLPEFSQGYMGEFYKDQPGSSSQFHLQPLQSIHLDSHLEGEMQPNGNRDIVYILLIVAGFIAVIAIVNQINLNSSKSMERLREIGVRKIIGSTNIQLTRQLLVESLLLNSIATLIGLVLVVFVYPYFNTLFDAHVSIAFFALPAFWMALAATVLLVSVICSLYPWFVLSHYKIMEAVKGRSMRGRSTRFQRALVAFQFTVSLVLIIATYSIFKQVDFMQTRDLGFGIHKKIVVKILPGVGDEGDSTFNFRLNAVKNDLLTTSFVESSTISSSIPGRKNEWRGRIRMVGQAEDVVLRGNLTRVDEDFIEAFNLRLLAGRNYTSTLRNEQSIIVNAEAVKRLGFGSPAEILGKKLVMFRDREIIGVVGSFHESGLQEELSPSMFITGEGYMKFLTIATRNGDIGDQIETIGKIWKARFPDKPFQYFLLDDFFNRQYRADVIMMRSIGLFSGIAILIACLGLLALSMYMIYRRTREIGIKKILGAAVSEITCELTVNFMIPVALSVFFAIPLAYQLIKWWLGHYAYKIGISVILFVVPVVVVVGIGLVSVVFQSVKAAAKNPVDSLKYE